MLKRRRKKKRMVLRPLTTTTTMVMMTFSLCFVLSCHFFWRTRVDIACEIANTTIRALQRHIFRTAPHASVPREHGGMTVEKEN